MRKSNFLRATVFVALVSLMLVAGAGVLHAHKTFTFAITNVSPGTAIVTQSVCSEVTIFENTSSPTTDFDVRVPASTNAAVTRPIGAKFTIKAPDRYFAAGATVGYVKAATGTPTFAQVEN